MELGLAWWSTGSVSTLQGRGHGFSPWVGNEDHTCRREVKPAGCNCRDCLPELQSAQPQRKMPQDAERIPYTTVKTSCSQYMH